MILPRRIVITLFIVLITACGGELELPPAAPLSVAQAQLQRIPSIEPGPWQPVIRDPVVLPASGIYRELPMRVIYPAVGGQEVAFPVLVFSHGNWSDREKYDAVLSHWVSHGYIVIAPTHLDGTSMARGIFNSLRYGQMGLIAERLDDVRRILADLPDIAAQVADPQLQMDASRIAVTGHSFGAFTAQQFIGAVAIEDGERLGAADERVLVAVALSPPGPMFEIINENSWKAIDRPMLVTTGTWDVNAQFWPDWRLHKLSHDVAPDPNKVALIVEGMDHYLGNLICRPEREQAPQTDALRMVNAVSTSFLNAWLKEDAAAAVFIGSDRLAELTGGFARLELD